MNNIQLSASKHKPGYWLGLKLMYRYVSHTQCEGFHCKYFDTERKNCCLQDEEGYETSL